MMHSGNAQNDFLQIGLRISFWKMKEIFLIFMKILVTQHAILIPKRLQALQNN